MGPAPESEPGAKSGRELWRELVTGSLPFLAALAAEPDTLVSWLATRPSFVRV